MNSIKSLFSISVLCVVLITGSDHLLSAQELVAEEDAYIEAGQEDGDDEAYAGPFSNGFSINDSIRNRSYHERSINVAEWQKLSRDPRYVYKKKNVTGPEKEDSGSSWAGRFISAVFEFLFSPIGKTLLWMLLAALVMWVVWRIFKNNGIYIFARGAGKVKAPDDHEHSDHFVPTSWETVIARAEESEDYRLALRHAFRHIVHKMQEQQILKSDNAQSNGQYLNALRNSVFFDDFRSLLRHYEYVWYGHYELGAASYRSVKRIYLEIRSKL